VAADFHVNKFRDTGSDHVPNSAPPLIMEEQARIASGQRDSTPRSPKIRNGQSKQKEETD
jgi:hypothetical protein